MSTKRNLIARDLRTPKYRKRVTRNVKAYRRNEKHRGRPQA